jgi:guanosine-diphosphatase
MFCIVAVVLFLYRFPVVDVRPDHIQPKILDKDSVLTGISGTAALSPTVGSTPPTTKCTVPHDPRKPLVQYIIMIDAGSTGSRIHVYRFNNCGGTPELEDEHFQMTETRLGGSGLSSYDDPEEAAASLDDLMQFAQSVVAREFHSRTPVAVKATAGLRLLGFRAASEILEAVRARLEERFPFPVVSRESGGVEVMDGEDEAVFAWLTANYLLGNLESGRDGDMHTAALLDLGGGSLQVVFQQFPGQELGKGKALQTDLTEDTVVQRLDFRGKEIQLYQHSHLGYGLMAARKTLHQLVVDRAPPHDTLSQPVLNPCLPVGGCIKVALEMPSDHILSGKHEVTMEGPANDSDNKTTATKCRKLIKEILHKDDTPCPTSPCSINGVHQPWIEEAVSGDVYVLSYFYDRTHPLGMPESFTLFDLHELVLKVCAGESAWPDLFGNVGGVVEVLREMPEWCLDLQYMEALLHDGFEVAQSRRLRVVNKINGYEVGWSLGASLALLEKTTG